MSDYLLVHGGFGVGWVWDDVAKRLERAGHRDTLWINCRAWALIQRRSATSAPMQSSVRRTLDAIDKPSCWWAIL